MKKLLLIPATITIGFAPIMSLSSCNKTKPLDFKTCSWADVCKACNDLEKGLITEKEFCHSFTNGPIEINKLTDFVGLAKAIEINGYKHGVTIIGVQEDYFADEDGNPTDKKVTFTFQFDRLISYYNQQKEFVWPYMHKWDDLSDEDDHSYLNSEARKYLNIDMMNLLPKDIVDNIKIVSKTTLENKYQEIPKVDIDTYNSAEKLWFLSTSEIYCPKSYKTDLTPKAPFNSYYTKEGKQYSFYAKYLTRQDDPTYSLALLIRFNADVTASGTWFLRSPELNDSFTQPGVCYIDGGGHAGFSTDIEYGNCMAPCFCL